MFPILIRYWKRDQPVMKWETSISRAIKLASTLSSLPYVRYTLAGGDADVYIFSRHGWQRKAPPSTVLAPERDHSQSSSMGHSTLAPTSM